MLIGGYKKNSTAKGFIGIKPGSAKTQTSLRSGWSQALERFTKKTGQVEVSSADQMQAGLRQASSWRTRTSEVRYSGFVHIDIYMN